MYIVAMLRANLVILITFLWISLSAQNIEYFEDKQYDEKIQSLQCFLKGWPLSAPILRLNSGNQLEFHFDDMRSEDMVYQYKFVHCNSDWTPSDIQYEQYMDGFIDNDIENYSPSFNTLNPYVHYQVNFPNDQIRPLVSGNYVFMVYKDYNMDSVVLTKRFFVYDPKVKINGMVRRPADVDFIDKGQEVSFSIFHERFPIRDPFSDLKVHVIQNMNWNTVKTGFQPIFIRQNELDYRDISEKNIFYGLSEFRNFDIKSMRYLTRQVRSFSYDYEYQYAFLEADKERYFREYFFDDDLNGNYLVKIQERDDDHLEADYVKVVFELPFEIPFTDGSLHVVGAFNHWHVDENSELEYNFDTRKYTKTLLLKQGYYNYQYVFKPKGQEGVELTTIEGSHYQTENDYFIFVYYRGPGDDLDHLIGVQIINSLNPKRRAF